MPTSATFHGRDVFAPAAAQLAARRRTFDEIGPIVAAARGPVVSEAERLGAEVRGSVIFGCSWLRSGVGKAMSSLELD